MHALVFSIATQPTPGGGSPMNSRSPHRARRRPDVPRPQTSLRAVPFALLLGASASALAALPPGGSATQQQQQQQQQLQFQQQLTMIGQQTQASPDGPSIAGPDGITKTVLKSPNCAALP